MRTDEGEVAPPAGHHRKRMHGKIFLVGDVGHYYQVPGTVPATKRKVMVIRQSPVLTFGLKTVISDQVLRSGC